MEWVVPALILFGSLMVLLFSGIPVAFAFITLNVVGVLFYWHGEAGLRLLTLSMWDSVSNFSLLPLPMFVLMGEVMFITGLGSGMMTALDKWIGRVPGRLGLLAVAGGTLFATLSGSAMASVAMLGSTLTPELIKRGYKKPMALGPILGSGGLAVMIPPTNLGVLLATIASISVGQLLIAIILPGLLMAASFAIYITIRCWLQPSIAPPYELPPVPWSDRIVSASKNILPLSLVVFSVIGIIFFGIATPTEAAALGALACILLAFVRRSLTWKVLNESARNTLKISGMILLILAGSQAFSQIISFSGVSRGMVEFAIGFPVQPIVIVLFMQIILLIMGCFMDPLSIMMISLPIFMPIIKSLGFDPIWFGVIVLLNMEMASSTPPFGMSLFVMKSVAAKDTTMGDIYLAGLPFLACDLFVMLLLIFVPSIVYVLPNLMH